MIRKGINIHSLEFKRYIYFVDFLLLSLILCHMWNKGWNLLYCIPLFDLIMSTPTPRTQDSFGLWISYVKLSWVIGSLFTLVKYQSECFAYLSGVPEISYCSIQMMCYIISPNFIFTP